MIFTIFSWIATLSNMFFVSLKVSHTFADKEWEFVFGPLCPDKFYEINFWVDRVKHIKVCAKCEHEGKCLKGEKMDKCDCFIKEDYPKDDDYKKYDEWKKDDDKKKIPNAKKYLNLYRYCSIILFKGITLDMQHTLPRTQAAESGGAL